MDPDKELEDIMKTRKIPDMRSNLAERIIEASQKHQGQGKGFFCAWLYAFGEELVIPKPAYVLAMLFVLGLLIGSLSAQSIVNDASYYATDMLFTAEEVFEGDWL